MNNFGDNLKYFRLLNKLNQQELAERLNTTQQRVSEWECNKVEGPHEAFFLNLDCSKIKSKLGWKPKWNVEKALEKTVEFSKIDLERTQILKEMEKQIKEYVRS